jgi:hypothetical protein
VKSAAAFVAWVRRNRIVAVIAGLWIVFVPTVWAVVPGWSHWNGWWRALILVLWGVAALVIVVTATRHVRLRSQPDRPMTLTTATQKAHAVTRLAAEPRGRRTARTSVFVRSIGDGALEQSGDGALLTVWWCQLGPGAAPGLFWSAAFLACFQDHYIGAVVAHAIPRTRRPERLRLCPQDH